MQIAIKQSIRVRNRRDLHFQMTLSKACIISNVFDLIRFWPTVTLAKLLFIFSNQLTFL